MDKISLRRGGTVMKDGTCKIIEDLLPLIEDGVASEESVEFVKNHMENCQSCKNQFSSGETNTHVETKINDEKVIRSIKRSVLNIQRLSLIFGTILGVGLTYTIGMFYNIAIMPLLGAISYISLDRKWYLTPLSIMVLTYIWQVVESITIGYFSWRILYVALTMTGIYGGLSLLGVLIAFLIKFALSKGDVVNEG